MTSAPHALVRLLLIVVGALLGCGAHSQTTSKAEERAAAGAAGAIAAFGGSAGAGHAGVGSNSGGMVGAIAEAGGSGGTSGSGGLIASGGSITGGDGGSTNGSTAGAAGMAGVGWIGGVDAVYTLQDLTATYCEVVGRCCPDRMVPPDVTAPWCLNLAGEPVPRKALLNGGVVLDLATVSACRSALFAALDHCAAPSVPGPCNHIYRGTRKAGDACTGAHECTPKMGGHAVCATNLSNQGWCVELLPGRAGDRCQGTCPADGSSDCSPLLRGAFGSENGGSAGNGGNPLVAIAPLCAESDGLSCDSLGSDYSCRPMPAVGQACDHYSACGPTNVCFENKICMSPLHQPCATYACHDHLVCINGTCELPQTFGQSFGCMGNFPDW